MQIKGLHKNIYKLYADSRSQECLDDKPVQEIKRAWDTIRKKSGFSDLRIHDLRHTYASHLVSKGVSLSIVGKLLGHTQAATTQRYAHLADESLRQAATLFGNNLDKIVGKEACS